MSHPDALMGATEAIPTAQELVQRAAALVPMLREKAIETEKARRVSDEAFDAVAEAGIFRMCVPKRYGGYEMDFQTQCDVLAHIARGCPSTSWVSTISSAMGWAAGVFPDEAQEEIFAGGDPRGSGAFSLTGTGTPKDGGLVVNGRWGYNTGCHGSKWTYLNVIVPGDDGDGVPTAVWVESSELTILDDWDATGMAGTGSNGVVAEDVFVPGYRTYPLFDLVEAKYPERHNSCNPYFNLPLVPVLAVNAGGTPLGTAQGALEAFLERLPGRPITYTNYTLQSEAPITHLQVGEAALTIDSCDAHVRRACEIVDTFDGSPMSLADRVRARAHIGFSISLARDAVEILFRGSGASAIQTTVPIQRYHRDIQALANHAVMSPSTNVELYGRALVGLEPNSPLV
jgi:alkylation response protein AidB-like acyl-CoA dehydrogenase